MPFPLALHCWLFAPDSDTRNRLDDVCETAESYDGSGVGFYGSEYEPYSASIGSDQILEKSLDIISDVLGWASSPEPAEPSPFEPKPSRALTRACSGLGLGFRFWKPKPEAQARA